MGQLKAKIAKLRRELISTPSGSGGGGGGVGFDVARTGVASVGFVGFPSVGKVCNMNLDVSDARSRTSLVLLVDTDVEVDRHTFRGLSH